MKTKHHGPILTLMGLFSLDHRRYEYEKNDKKSKVEVQGGDRILWKQLYI